MRRLLFLLTVLFTFSGLAVAETSRRFEDLSQENKKLVKETYRALLLAREKKDFVAMRDDAKTILELLDDYNDTRSYADIAERGLLQAAEEKDPAAQQARKKRRFREVADLEIQGQNMVTKAKKNAETRAELYELMNRLLALDPASTYPDEWRKALHSAAGGASGR